MRILLHGGVDIALPGGLETHLRELARGLMARGHAVEILGRPATLPPFTMVERLEPSRYDILHHHAGRWPRALDRHPGLVRTFHYSTAAKMRVYVRLGRLRTLANLPNWRAIAEERASARRGGPLIAVSRRLRDELVEGYGLAAERVRVIPNGVAFAAPATGRAGWRTRWSIPAAAPVLLTIGRADFVKGFDLLERAWARARKPAGALWVTVGGAAPARAPGRIVTGPVPPDEIVEWVHAADVGALPSYYEGGGIALLEMLAGGLYSLTHDVGCASEVIRPRANGELVSRDERAWIEALARTLAEPRVARAPALPPEYHWDAIAARVEDVYREALGGSRG